MSLNSVTTVTIRIRTLPSSRINSFIKWRSNLTHTKSNTFKCTLINMSHRQREAAVSSTSTWLPQRLPCITSITVVSVMNTVPRLQIVINITITTTTTLARITQTKCRLAKSVAASVNGTAMLISITNKLHNSSSSISRNRTMRLELARGLKEVRSKGITLIVSLHQPMEAAKLRTASVDITVNAAMEARVAKSTQINTIRHLLLLEVPTTTASISHRALLQLAEMPLAAVASTTRSTTSAEQRRWRQVPPTSCTS